MTTPMISDNWSRFVLPLVRKEWIEKQEAIASPAMQFFGIETSKSSVEYSQGVGSFGLIDEYNAASDGDNAIEYDSFTALFEQTFTHKEYAKGVASERKLWDDAEIGTIRRKAAGLGVAFGTTRATHASSIFNNAFSSSYLGGDSKSLCNAAHPANSKSETTYSNAGSTAISEAAVTSTLLAGHAMKDDRGNPMPVIYDVLYVPGALQATAYDIAKTLAPAQTTSQEQFVSSRGLKVVVDPYLTDAKNWFMLDSSQSALHLLRFNRIMPEINADPASNLNLKTRLAGYMRYSFGWDDARFIYGHAVA